MKAAELRDLGADQLGAKERELVDQLFRMRIQKSMGQLDAPDKLRTVRRDLARIKTVQRQKKARNVFMEWIRLHTRILDGNSRARVAKKIRMTGMEGAPPGHPV